VRVALECRERPAVEFHVVRPWPLSRIVTANRRREVRVGIGRERLGELLIEAGMLNRNQLEEALATQAVEGGKLGEVLVRALVLTEDMIADALAKQKNLEHVSLLTYPIDRTVTQLIPERMAKRREIIPLRVDGDLLVLAMADPLDIESIDDVEMRTGYRVRPVVASSSQVRNAIDKYIVSADALQNIVQGATDIDDEVDIQDSDDVPIVRLVNQVILEAVREGASDIHFEPDRKKLTIRTRVDGVMRKVMELPASVRPGVTSRLKIMAEMNIAERRLPQDGRIGLRVDAKMIDIRVASLPTPHGESLTLRILNSELAFRSLNELGISEAELKILTRLINRPYGALLVSGPTGSGKSTTLYAILHEIAKPVRKVITVEDPIEYQMSGITQMSVNNRIGLSFAVGLRTILRSDPDIVMVGEIRDPETAEIAVRSALTGHLVLSSIHTNDAPSALTRLTDMGVPAYITSSGILAVIAQRLVRALCKDCNIPLQVSPSRLEAAGFSLEEIDGLSIFGPEGCEKCGNSGYRGRVAVIELMEIDERIICEFLERAPAERLRALAVESGMITMRQNALQKVREGITSLEEIDRMVP